jgi:hypothetical protein
MTYIIGEAITLPANGTRLFESVEKALEQPTGVVQFAWDELNPYLFNSRYEEKVVLYDDNYDSSITNNLHQPIIPTKDYFPEVLRKIPQKPFIIEIGSGKGEFIQWLLDLGLDAVGYDPVISKSKKYLYKDFYSLEQKNHPHCDLFVMRCVLPHIKNPWEYIYRLFDQYPSAKILIEYQRIEFIIKNKLWFSLSHGHVNQFTLQDFRIRFNVVDYGEFDNGEWQWILIDSKGLSDVKPLNCNFSEALINLVSERTKFINHTKDLGPVALYGGAGKGAVLALALKEAGAEILNVIDSSPNRFDKYLEVSGVKVISPETALKTLPSNTKVILCNPNHYDYVKNVIKMPFKVFVASAL